MKIKIEITGTEGTQTKTVNVAATGASVAEICKQAGIDPKGKDFTVNGKTAGADTHVGKDDVFSAKDRTTTVAVSARPQGS